jgi:hypothetical protein
MRNQNNGGRLRQSHPERLLALAADIRLAAEVHEERRRSPRRRNPDGNPTDRGQSTAAARRMVSLAL